MSQLEPAIGQASFCKMLGEAPKEARRHRGICSALESVSDSDMAAELGKRFRSAELT